MRFTPDFLDDLRMRLSLADYIGRRVRLTKKGREHSGLCPFHNEKTPSFTVNEEKGFYHCFGCGAHGDIIKFAMETEGVSFPEAIERLADEAGLALPAEKPGDRQEAAKRKGQYEVLETATSWFETQLRSDAAIGARDYLTRRGLSEATISAFRLGLAPNRRTYLRDSMTSRDITEPQLVETGLVIKLDDGGEAYDRFRDRIIFPIADVRGRVVAFGGRALGEARAKYLNSPETDLFHKGTMLYNMDKARAAAREKDRLIVVEGYMDVIGLAQVGIKEAVAPLGTALTEQQIQQLWRSVPEPVLCFDGDNAGLRASRRAMERVLPLLKPGHSLRFAYLPAGEDPDSLVAANGAGAFEALLEEAKPLIDVLWDTLLEQGSTDTPERRAGFRASLVDAARNIGDDTVRRFYMDDLGNRFKKMGQPAVTNQQAGNDRYSTRQDRPFRRGGRDFQPPVSAELLRTPLAQSTGEPSSRRDKMLVLAILNHPRLLDDLEEELFAVHFEGAELDKIHAAIIHIAVQCRADSINLESGTLKDHLRERGFADSLARMEADRSLLSDGFVRTDAPYEQALRGVRHLLDEHQLHAVQQELHQAEMEAADHTDKELLDRAALRIKALRDQIGELKGKIARHGEFPP